MNKKSLQALLLAVLVPLICFFIIRRLSDSSIVMPQHYLPDSTYTKIVKGKKVTETTWEKLPNFSLINQQGDSVNWDMLKGKIVVADFFFTRCPTICPQMTLNMRQLQRTITNAQRVGDKTPDFIHFLSFSIDPERDSVQRLKQWADRFQVNPEQWWLLTGPKKEIYNMAIDKMKIGVQDGKGIDTSFFHSDFFVLVDANRQVRGYYRGLDSTALKELAGDIIYLTMEKDPNRKSFFAGKLQLIAIVFLSAIIGVAVLLFFIRKKSTNAHTGLEEK